VNDTISMTRFFFAKVYPNKVSVFIIVLLGSSSVFL